MSAAETRTPHTRTASYEAEPGDVGRVLLLYSGGLDPPDRMQRPQLRARGRRRDEHGGQDQK